MTKEELVSEIAKKTNAAKKRAKITLTPVIGAIHQILKEEGEIRVDQLCTFKVVERNARTGVHPRTGAKIAIPAIKVPIFRAAKVLKDTVKGTRKLRAKQKE